MKIARVTATPLYIELNIDILNINKLIVYKKLEMYTLYTQMYEIPIVTAVKIPLFYVHTSSRLS